MTGIPKLRRLVALALAVMMFVLMGPVGAARAALVSTEQVIGANAATADRDRVAAFLGRDDVRRQMVALGSIQGKPRLASRAFRMPRCIKSRAIWISCPRARTRSSR
jgi:hypothetical protein